MTRHRGAMGGPRHLLLLLVLLCGCSMLTSFDEDLLTEDTFERCRDGVDNDSDGVVDCDDLDCGPFGICGELSVESCDDGQDNDGDGLIDCTDPGCTIVPGACVERTSTACTDGADNDNDGLSDCDDPDCAQLDVCRETTAEECSDGADNDGDGLSDCEDFGCYAQPACCQFEVTPLTGDSFDHHSSCSIEGCEAKEPTCCVAGYETCNPFDPAIWVAWGLPRARQVDQGFLSNDPCGCDASGIVSVERIALRPQSALQFRLSLSEGDSLVCGGITTSQLFPDDRVQCASVAQPQLLAGVCLDAGPVPTLRAVVNGKTERQAPLPSGGPQSVSIRFTKQATAIDAGPLQHSVPTLPQSPAPSALVLVYGQGTGGRLDRLRLEGDPAPRTRCSAPGSWYRHLARGEAVVGSADHLLAAKNPTVIYRSTSKTYLMLFEGASVDGGDGLYAATSSDGIVWTVTGKPVIPASPTDVSFGLRQRAPTLLQRDGLLHLWYGREDESNGAARRGIAYARSVDGLSWTAVPGPRGEPFVLEASSPPLWDSLAVSSPTVLLAPDGDLLMWYTGIRADVDATPAIGIARSPDGVNWIRASTGPVLDADRDAGELGISDPMVVWDAARGVFRLWHSVTSFGTRDAIGYAVSADGLRWQRWPAPVFVGGAAGTFDARGSTGPALLSSAGRHRMWYSGANSVDQEQIGYAENRGAE